MNVLWIVIDCLRRDRLAAYQPGRVLAPHLDRFSQECLVLDQAISPHIPTQPAHTTFFSGRDVFDHQIVAQGGRQELDPAIPLLPTLLRSEGYYTGAVDNIGRWIEPAFERYESYPRWDHNGSLPWRNGEQVTERGLHLLEEAARDPRPFFLFFHYWDPHTPYLPPSPHHRRYYAGDERDPGHTSMDPVWASPWFANYFREWLDGVRDIEFVKAEYDASITYCDACLAPLFARLGELGLWEDTLVLLHADHGEELDDHGCWFDHHGLYDTNVLVPVLLRFPQGRHAGQRVPHLTSLLDLAPTVLQELGLSHHGAALTGRPLQPWLEGGPEPGREGFYLTECTWMRKRGWRTAEWKLIEALEPDIYGKPPVELFHLPADPAEQQNVAELYPDVTAELRAARDAHIARRLAETGLPDPSLAQADALRIWQPRFIAGRVAGATANCR